MQKSGQWASAWAEDWRLFTSSWQRTRILALGLSSSPPFSGGPGKSPVMPGYLQVAGDVCKATPFLFFLSSTFRPLFSLHAFFFNLDSFPLFEDPRCFCLLGVSILRPEVLGLYKRFSERLCSLLPINCAFCSWGGNQALEALHRVSCFYKKFSHLIEHLGECFHVEVIDKVQYSCTWS